MLSDSIKVRRATTPSLRRTVNHRRTRRESGSGRIRPADSSVLSCAVVDASECCEVWVNGLETPAR